MIRRIEIQNFMSIKEATIDLEPLTIFIGHNASGKSAIFKAVVTVSKLLRAALRGKEGEFYLENGVPLDDLVWSGNSGLPIRFRMWLDDDIDETNPSYALELSKRAEGWSVTHEKLRAGNNWIEVDENHPFEHPSERYGPQICKPPMRATLRFLVDNFKNDSAARPVIEPIIQIANRIGETWRYRPSAGDIAKFVKSPTPKKPPKRERGFYVSSNGYGVAKVLQELQGDDRATFTEIEDSLRKLFPHIKTIGFKSDWPGIRLQFTTDRSEDPIPAPQESDGVLLGVFLLWRLYSANPPICICLEEPENGLHPHLLGDRFETLKKFAYPDGKNGEPVQVLVATHSRELLRLVRAHHSVLFKQLRTVRFSPRSGTLVGRPSNFKEAKGLFDKYR